jgi:hypothetical protein
MEYIWIYILIYLLIIFINFYYFNKKEYQSISDDNGFEIVLIVFIWPILLLYNISKYWLPKLFKIKHKYTWDFKWWDIIEWPKGDWIYIWPRWSTDSEIIYEWSDTIEHVNNQYISIKYRWECSEELAMLAEATKLQKKANELLAKKKKTIYN